jgi:hypothetical protein
VAVGIKGVKFSIFNEFLRGKGVSGVGKPKDSHFVLVIFGLCPYIGKECGALTLAGKEHAIGAHEICERKELTERLHGQKSREDQVAQRKKDIPSWPRPRRPCRRANALL